MLLFALWQRDQPVLRHCQRDSANAADRFRLVCERREPFKNLVQSGRDRCPFREATGGCGDDIGSEVGRWRAVLSTALLP
jgi:hypothetical protein